MTLLVRCNLQFANCLEWKVMMGGLAGMTRCPLGEEARTNSSQCCSGILLLVLSYSREGSPGQGSALRAGAEREA